MSLKKSDVVGVLLADGWHTVMDDTFELLDFQFIGDGQLIHQGPAGFGFFEPTGEGRYIVGPLTAILAVSMGPDEESE